MGIVRFHTNGEASRVLGHEAGCGDCYWNGSPGACDSAECDGGIFMESTGPSFERAPTGDLVHLKRSSDYKVEVLNGNPPCKYCGSTDGTWFDRSLDHEGNMVDRCRGCGKSASEINPLDVQEGGSHYKHFAIQPVEYIYRNNLGYCEGNVVKYISRYKEKNGKEDLLKARHYIDLLLQMRYEDDGV